MEKTQNVKKYKRCVLCGRVYYPDSLGGQNCECGSDLFWVVEHTDEDGMPLCVGGWQND